MIGPGLLLKPDGTPSLGAAHGGGRASLAIDFPDGGFPNVPATAGSPDAPFFAALGSGAFGDITGDGLPEYVAPTGGLRKLLDIVGAPAQPGVRRALAHQIDGVESAHRRAAARVPALDGRHAVLRRARRSRTSTATASPR